MKIFNEKPPLKIYERAEKVFGSVVGMCFCFGDTIYFPDGNRPELPPDVVAHEKIHTKQQGEHPKEWWKRYLSDPVFRAEQELAAYRRQYQFCCELIKDKNERFWILQKLAGDMSSPVYGECISKEEAIKKIKS